jgi:hypothetical protein
MEASFGDGPVEAGVGGGDQKDVDLGSDADANATLSVMSYRDAISSQPA